jgi:molybdopterin converting factor subunit 1
MIVTVVLFARARDLAGTDRVRVDLPEGATVADLRRLLAEAVPLLAGLLSRSAIAVNRDFAPDDQVLWQESEIALLPPVSGG